MFANEQPTDLARTLVALLRAPRHRNDLAIAGQERARLFDWPVVADKIMAVYETVIEGRMASQWEPERRWGRFLPGRAGR